jgi:hypothetical protein
MLRRPKSRRCHRQPLRQSRPRYLRPTTRATVLSYCPSAWIWRTSQTDQQPSCAAGRPYTAARRCLTVAASCSSGRCGGVAGGGGRRGGRRVVAGCCGGACGRSACGLLQGASIRSNLPVQVASSHQRNENARERSLSRVASGPIQLVMMMLSGAAELRALP